MKAAGYPHSLCGVVYQGAGSGHGCQFSFACDGKMLEARSAGAWARAKHLALRILSGVEQLGNETADAVSFHAVDVEPGWDDRAFSNFRGANRGGIIRRGQAGHRCGTPILEEHSARRADSGSYHGRSQKLAPVKLFHPATSDLFNSSGPPIVLAVWYYEPPSLSLECVELSSSIHLFPAKNQDDQN